MIDSKALIKIFDVSPSASLLLLPDAPYFTIVEVNQAYLDITNTNKGDLIGKSIFEALPKSAKSLLNKEGADLHQSLLKVIDTNKSHKMPVQRYKILSKSNERAETKYWTLQNIPITDDANEVGFILHTIQDDTLVTGLNKAELKLHAKLIERNKFIETIFENIPIGIAVNKIDSGEATIVNNKFSEIYGWPSEVISNISSFFNHVYPQESYRNEITKRISEDIESGDINRMAWNNITITTSTGEQKVIDACNIPLFEQGVMISTVLDVTKATEHAAEVINTKANQEALINATDDLVWSIDKEYCLISFNNAYQEVFKSKANRNLSLGDSVLAGELDDAYIAEWKSYYDRALNGESFTANIEFFNPKTVSIEYRESSLKPIKNTLGEVVGAACFCKDITESKYYLELEKLERDILELNAKGNQSRVDILNQYMLGIEWLHQGMICSLQTVKDNKLYSLSSPSLPEGYLQVISGAEIQNNSGSCGTSAYLKDRVIVSDITIDERWGKYKDIAAKYDLRACWSRPIINYQGNVIATFSNYYREVKSPTSLEENTIQRAGHILKVLLEGYQREDALQLSNQRYEYVTKATFDAIWDWDLQTGNVYLGEGYKDIFGEIEITEPTDIHKIFNRIHPEEIKAVSDSGLNAIKSQCTDWTYELRYLKSDGTYATVSTKASIIRDNNGEAIRVIGAMQDISDQKEREQSTKLMESLITNTNDAILIAVPNKVTKGAPVITYVNDAFVKLTGYSAEEVIGQTPEILHGPNSDWDELNQLWASMENAESCVVNIVNYKKSGEEFWTNLSVSPIANSNGLVTHWVHIGRDISKKKQEEFQKKLLDDIAIAFTKDQSLKQTLNTVVEQVVDFGQFNLAEIWLLDPNCKKLVPAANYNKSSDTQKFYNASLKQDSFAYGEGLPGQCWKEKRPVLYRNIDQESKFKRWEAAQNAGLKTAYALPMLNNNDFIGTLLLGFNKEVKEGSGCNVFLDNFGMQLGSKIKRKQLEQELKQIFMYAPDVICIANLEGYFTKLNPAMCVMLEYSESEILSMPLLEFVHPEDRERTESEYKSLENGLPTTNFENRCITKSGNIIWMAWSVSPLIDDGMLFCVAKDITEKKQLENLLNKSNNLARIGSWDYDVKDDKLYWSDITREIVEADPDYQQTLESTIMLYKEGDCRDLLRKSAEDAINHGTPIDIEVQIVTMKGDEKWVRVIAEAELIDGKCTRVYGSFQDIDARKRAELGLLKSFDEKNTILESVGDGFFSIDFNWIVTYWNKQAEILLHRPKNEIVGKNAWEVYSDVIDTTFYKYYFKTMEERTVQHFEAYYDTISAWFEVSSYPSTNGISVYFKDITERKLSEIKLNELNENVQKHAKELAVSNADLEQFAYVASHDLQEPLRMVTSFLTRLESKYGDVLDEKGKKYIYFAVDGAKRMRQIILDLLEFSRVGRVEETIEKLDLNEVISEIEILYRKQIEEKRAEIITDTFPAISGNKSSFRQVFQNLISNALKYSTPDTQVKINITVRDHNKHWLFAIEDNGIGIEEEYFGKIFIVFQRLHSIEEYSGTGMGLAVTKKIIENLGGDIWLESSVGVGSTFYFTVPKE